VSDPPVHPFPNDTSIEIHNSKRRESLAPQYDLFALDAGKQIEEQRPAIPCFEFNKLIKGCDLKECLYDHVCAACGSSRHNWSSCLSRTFCLAFSRNGICKSLDCVRRHYCMLCHERHPLNDVDCAMYRERVKECDHPDSYCFLWNGAGNCKKADCSYKHACLYCKSYEHGSADCVNGLVTLILGDYGEL
jgi:hypothetical protein